MTFDAAEVAAILRRHVETLGVPPQRIGSVTFCEGRYDSGKFFLAGAEVAVDTKSTGRVK